MNAPDLLMSDGLPGRVCFVGLGNPALSDDGLGVRLAETLRNSGIPASVLVAGTAPEQHLGRLMDGAFDHVVFLDAVDYGGVPGSAVLLGAAEIAARFPQVSTHRISLGTLARLIESRGRTKVWLLGVQPESLRPGTTLTRTVQRTREMLVALCRPTPSEVAR